MLYSPSISAPQKHSNFYTVERKKKKCDNRRRLISPGRKKVRKRSRINKACIQRAERARKNTLIFTSAQRQGRLSFSLSLSLFLFFCPAAWARFDDGLTAEWSYSTQHAWDFGLIWIARGTFWNALPVSVHVCLRGKERKTPPSFPPPLHKRATAGLRLAFGSEPPLPLSFPLSFSKSLFTL